MGRLDFANSKSVVANKCHGIASKHKRLLSPFQIFHLVAHLAAQESPSPPPKRKAKKKTNARMAKKGNPLHLSFWDFSSGVILAYCC